MFSKGLLVSVFGTIGLLAALADWEDPVLQAIVVFFSLAFIVLIWEAHKYIETSVHGLDPEPVDLGYDDQDFVIHHGEVRDAWVMIKHEDTTVSTKQIFLFDDRIVQVLTQFVDNHDGCVEVTELQRSVFPVNNISSVIAQNSTEGFLAATDKDLQMIQVLLDYSSNRVPMSVLEGIH